MKKRVVTYGYGLVILLMIGVSLFYIDELKFLFSDPEKAKEFIASFGMWGPLVLIMLQFLQVVIFVIPGPVFTVAGGYAFGNILGTIYSLIGTMLGSILVFYLGRLYGRPFVEKIVAKKDLQYYDAFFKKRGKLALFVVRTIPIIFSNDAVSFAMALTSIKMKDYIIISFLGFIPNIIILNVFGNHLADGTTLLVLSIMFGFGAGILFWMFRDFIKNYRKN